MSHKTNTELLDIQLVIVVLGTIATAICAWTILDIMTPERNAYPLLMLIASGWFALMTGGFWFLIKAELLLWGFVIYGIYWLYN